MSRNRIERFKRWWSWGLSDKSRFYYKEVKKKSLSLSLTIHGGIGVEGRVIFQGDVGFIIRKAVVCPSIQGIHNLIGNVPGGKEDVCSIKERRYPTLKGNSCVKSRMKLNQLIPLMYAVQCLQQWRYLQVVSGGNLARSLLQLHYSSRLLIEVQWW